MPVREDYFKLSFISSGWILKHLYEVKDKIFYFSLQLWLTAKTMLTVCVECSVNVTSPLKSTRFLWKKNIAEGGYAGEKQGSDIVVKNQDRNE